MAAIVPALQQGIGADSRKPVQTNKEAQTCFDFNARGAGGQFRSP